MDRIKLAPGQRHTKALPATAAGARSCTRPPPQNGVDAVAVTAFQIIAAHAVLGLQMSDDRLDRRSPLHLTFESGCGPAHLARDPDLEAVRVIVPAVALVDIGASDLNLGHGGDIGHCGRQRVAVIPKRSSRAASPWVFRRTSRITGPSRARRNRNSRFGRLN